MVVTHSSRPRAEPPRFIIPLRTMHAAVKSTARAVFAAAPAFSRHFRPAFGAPALVPSFMRGFAAAAIPAGPKPFKVLGIQQVAIGGPSKSALSSLWVDLFGCTKTNDFKSERENVDEDILTLGKGPYAVEIDLMQPINPEKVHVSWILPCFWCMQCRAIHVVVKLWSYLRQMLEFASGDCLGQWPGRAGCTDSVAAGF